MSTSSLVSGASGDRVPDGWTRSQSVRQHLERDLFAQLMDGGTGRTLPSPSTPEPNESSEPAAYSARGPVDTSMPVIALKSSFIARQTTSDVVQAVQFERHEQAGAEQHPSAAAPSIRPAMERSKLTASLSVPAPVKAEPLSPQRSQFQAALSSGQVELAIRLADTSLTSLALRQIEAVLQELHLRAAQIKINGVEQKYKQGEM